MEQTFLTYLKNSLSIPDKAGILLAISGGVDSMCMLRLFEKTNYRIIVAHVNFQLRGLDSEGDELMIKNYCEERQIGFESIKFETLEYAKENNVSTQMAARALRYLWFEELLVKHHLDYIATAHHAEDSIETALLNLTRGTGIRGLKGILGKQGKIIRPILFAQKMEIMAFAMEQAINWREDSSNSSDKYKRNFIRHQVIPLLKELNPKLTENFQNTSDRISTALTFIEKQKEQFIHEHVKKNLGDYNLDKTIFYAADNEALVSSWLESFGFNYSQINSILKSGNGSSGTCFNSKSHVLTIDRNEIIIGTQNKIKSIEVQIQKNTKKIEVAFGRLDFEMVSEFPQKDSLNNPSKAFLDISKLKYPLVIRNWRQGDRFKPYGMKGSKLISDFLIDLKIPILQKRKTLVLCSGDNIVWLVNYRVSSIAAINLKSDNILVISYSAI